MQSIYCNHNASNGGQGHFLARLSGDKLELWCVKCKAFHPVLVVDIVRGMIHDYQTHSNGHDPEKEDKLLW